MLILIPAVSMGSTVDVNGSVENRGHPDRGAFARSFHRIAAGRQLVPSTENALTQVPRYSTAALTLLKQPSLEYHGARFGTRLKIRCNI